MSAEDTFVRAQRLHQAGHRDEAEALYRELLAAHPDHAPTLHLLGTLCYETARYADAISLLRRAAALAPGSAATLANLGAALSVSGQLREAAAIATRAVALAPGNAQIQNLAGHLAQQLGDPVRAVAHLREAVRIAPALTEARHNLAIALHKLGHFDEALDNYRKALEASPDDAQLHFNMALALQAAGDPSAAIAALAACLALAPGHLEALDRLAYLQRLVCDFDGLDQTLPALERRLREHVAERGPTMIWPFSLNVVPVEAAVHDAVAEYFSAQVEQRARALATPFDPQPRSRERLRIGYLSADFRSHAVGSLVHSLFGAHDRAKISVHAYSLLASDDEFQRAVREQAEVFRDLTPMPPAEAARIIHDDGLDVLVDLSGYTAHARPEILALRPAPVQVSWLGYLNTMRARFIDYLIADEIVITAAMRERYSEAIVTLPGTFLPGARLPVGETPPRDALGLDRDAFVFCSFNHSHKIDRALFAAWMEILARVPDSVLWLYAGGMAVVEPRLRSAAAAAGVDPARLVFAGWAPIAEHMGRLSCAELFLDAFHYNAGATAIGVAQVGVPMLTCTGDSLLSRMTTSVNTALGLTALNCADARAYVDLAVELATDSDRYAALRAQAGAAAQSEVFSMRVFARRLEWAYERMHARCVAGEVAKSFAIKP